MMAAISGRYSICDRNLGLLQELIGKDADSYREEFVEQLQHYMQTMKLLHLQPSQHRMDVEPLLELIGFLSHVSYHYPKDAKQLAEGMVSILRSQSVGLNCEVRMAFCKALVVLRNHKVVPPLDVLELFFELLKCSDKPLRKFIYGAVISQLRRISKEKRDQQLLSRMQSFLFAKLKDSRSIVARTAELILIDAYRKDLLRDAKTANAIAECCFHKVARIQATAMRFFLGSIKDEEGIEEESESDNGDGKEEDRKTIKEVMCAFRARKKTRKKVKIFEKTKKALSKEKKAKKDGRSKVCNLLAIQSLYDAQSLSDRLFGQLESRKNEKFELRLLQMALCARIIGVWRLQTLGFYSYLHRYLQPKQREVTRILLYAAQACHELVPPDIIEQLVRVIAQNFVTDRNTPEAITVGLNAIREVFASCPYAATEELLRDLAEYKKYKNKNVSMAARGLITLFRSVNPKLLHKKDRGRPTEAMKELEAPEFGAVRTKSYVAGAECLSEVRGEDEGYNDESSDGSWEDVIESDDNEEGHEGNDADTLDKRSDGEQGIDENEIEEANNESERSDEEWETDDGGEGDGLAAVCEQTAGMKQSSEQSNSKRLAIRRVHFKDIKADARREEELSAEEKAKKISETRILTQEEFRKIRVYQMRKQIATKRQIEGTRKRRNDDIKLDEELEEKFARREEGDGLPRLKDIEQFHKKIYRQSKEERIASVEAGREGREHFGKPKKKGAHVGRTNRELAKRKNYQMVRQKVRGKNRKRSFRDQQLSLKKYLLKQSGKRIV
uniref:Protein SDA1 n=2 Tax=Parascaris univalens TaxID=6257 RepID=A0A914ZVM1_PARUN